MLFEQSFMVFFSLSIAVSCSVSVSNIPNAVAIEAITSAVDDLDTSEETVLKDSTKLVRDFYTLNSLSYARQLKSMAGNEPINSG